MGDVVAGGCILALMEVVLVVGLRARRRAVLAAAASWHGPRRADIAAPDAAWPGLAPWADREFATAARRLRLDADAATTQLVAVQLQLLSLHEVLRGLAGEPGPDRIVDALLRHCRDRCDTVEVRCYLTADPGRLLLRRLDLRAGNPPPDQLEMARPTQGGLASVLDDLASLLIGDPVRHPLVPGEAARSGEGYMAAPLVGAARGEVQGALVVFGTVGGGGLEEGTRVWMEALGRAAGAVLENAALYGRLNAEHTLRDGILNNLASGLIAFGARGQPLFHNRAARELLGLDEAAVARLTPAKLCPDLECPDSPLAAVVAGGSTLASAETFLVCPGRSPLTVRLTLAALPPPVGGDRGLMCVFDDLTARRAMEAQIRQLDKLAAIGRFTSSLAHEIRNPLAGIAAGIDYLRRTGGLGGEQQEYIRIISQEIDRLDRIIRHLFTVARPGYLMIRTLSLAPALERVLATLGPAAAQKRVTISTGPAGGWRELECDEDQIQQVLLNLIKNAVEAEQEGGEVRVLIGTGAREGEAFGSSGGEAAGVVIIVENGGETIAATERERIFEPFYSRKPGGTGLGLFVSFNIVKQHDGLLASVDAPPGRTRFRLFLPYTQPRTAEVA